MIPKRIFYVWGAGEDKRRDVNACIQSWRTIMPDFEIVEINQESTKYFNWAHEVATNDWFRAITERNLWAFIADYVRIKVLLDNGGVYFDTDVQVVRSVADLMGDRAIVGIQEEKHVEPAILMAPANNKFIAKIFDFYKNDGGIWNEPIYTIPQIFRKFLISEYGIDGFPPRENQEIIETNDITIYPERYFIPFRIGEKFTPECITADTRTIHWWGGSWVKPNILKWISSKHLPARRNDKLGAAEIYRVRLFNIVPLWTAVRGGNITRYYVFGKLRIAKKTDRWFYFGPIKLISSKQHTQKFKDTQK